MSVEAVRLVEQARQASPSEATPDDACCAPDSLATVLSQILERPVSAEQVWRKAVGLGLIRWPADGTTPLLTALAASRLLIAGYGVPGQVETTILSALSDRAPECRYVFVLAQSNGAASGQLLMAAEQWCDLPTQGAVFFGGSREPNGTYHWNVAELDTDREGRILRY